MKLGRRPSVTTTLIQLLDYVLMLFVLLYSSMWALFTSANCNTFLRLSYPLLAVLLFLRLRAKAIPAGRWKRLVVLAVFLGIYLVATRYNIPRYLLYYAGPLLLLTLYLGLVDEQGDVRQLLYKLSDIVLVLAVISLFCFIFGTCLGILPRDTVTYDWAQKTRTCGTYFNLYYESQSIHFLGFDLQRNCGLFMEAPGFAVFLVYAAAVEGLLRDKPRWISCAILCATAVTTFSAKAILLVVMVFGLRYVAVKSRSTTARRLKMLLIPVVITAVALVGIVLIKDKMTSDSFYIRIDDLRACIKTWLTNPLVGTGYWNDESIIPFFTYAGRYNDGLSMGYTVILAQGGLMLLALYIIPLITCIIRSRGSRRPMIAAFFIVYVALMFITNMPYSYLALFILALSLEWNRKRSRRTA